MKLELQYLGLIDKIMGYEGGVRKTDSYGPAAIRASLLEKWSEAEGNAKLTISEKGRIRLRVLDAIAELQRFEVRERAELREAARGT